MPDGDAAYDGVCEVCHTQTTHFRNNGGGSDQLHTNIGSPAGTNRISCHSHLNGFAHGGGSGTGCDSCHGHDAGWQSNNNLGKGTFRSHSTHTENDSDDLKGPYVNCDACHDTSNFPYFKSGTDQNGDGGPNRRMIRGGELKESANEVVPDFGFDFLMACGYQPRRPIWLTRTLQQMGAREATAHRRSNGQTKPTTTKNVNGWGLQIMSFHSRQEAFKSASAPGKTAGTPDFSVKVRKVP
ncbi:MAG: hypothetical protein HZA14_08750 [Nitrospirae bacterium]|nr:hypothetical protein [Nitrospirota bacterium]